MSQKSELIKQQVKTEPKDETGKQNLKNVKTSLEAEIKAIEAELKKTAKTAGTPATSANGDTSVATIATENSNMISNNITYQFNIDQFNIPKMTKVENALMWLYVKTEGLQGQHVIDKEELWNFGGEDLQEAIIGIAYPIRKKDEAKDEVETQEDLVESLRKLIMGKFDEKKDEFYKWSQTIHDEAMVNIPMKVQTKTLAFTDPTGVANDCKLEKLEKFITGKIQRLEKFRTGETSIIAFRATANKNGQVGNASYSRNNPVEWKNVDYNLGNYFDGTYFTVPENGLYYFKVCCRQESINYGQIHLYINANLHIYADRKSSNNSYGFVNIDTTLKLVKNDKVHVRFYGDLYSTYAPTTYFEGRMIARLDG